MPTYEYACTSCGEHVEAVQSFSDDPLTTCPACGGTLRKVFAPVGIVLKGSGFYKTDSRAAAGKGGGGRGDAAKDGGSSPENKGKGDGASTGSGDGGKGSSPGSGSSAGSGDGGKGSGGTGGTGGSSSPVKATSTSS